MKLVQLEDEENEFSIASENVSAESKQSKAQMHSFELVPCLQGKETVKISNGIWGRVQPWLCPNPNKGERRKKGK
jgi:hypothetical protein